MTIFNFTVAAVGVDIYREGSQKCIRDALTKKKNRIIVIKLISDVGVVGREG